MMNINTYLQFSDDITKYFKHNKQNNFINLTIICALTQLFIMNGVF